MFGLFLIGLPIANLVGALVSALLLRLYAFGLRGRQWPIVAEAMPAVILGAITLFNLTVRPRKANRLSSQERPQLFQTIVTERMHDRPVSVR